MLTFLLTAYLALTLQGSLASLASPSGHFATSLGPAMIMLAFRWFGPLYAVTASVVIGLIVEMQYQAIPGTMMFLLTFLALLVSNATVKSWLSLPFVWLLACVPIVAGTDYLLIVTRLLLSPPAGQISPEGASEILTNVLTRPILPSLYVGIKTMTVMTVWMIIVLGLANLFVNNRNLPQASTP